MLNQIHTLVEVVDKIDNKEDLYSERAKFDLERSFSVSLTTPSGSPFTGKSRSESCKSRQSFSSRHSSVDTDCLLESERNHLSHHNLSQVWLFTEKNDEFLILSKFSSINGFIGVVPWSLFVPLLE